MAPAGQRAKPGKAVPPRRSTYNQRSPLAMNLGPVSPVSREQVFADLFMASTRWVSVSANKWNDGRKLNVNVEGWVSHLLPGQSAGAQIRAPASGRYVATYRGLGIVTLKGKGVKIVEERRGRIAFTARAGSTVSVVIRATNPTDPVRAIRILPADLQSAEPPLFNPQLLAAARRFSVVRFNGWTRASTSRVVTWSDRTLPEARSQATGRGVAYEHIAALANALQADVWLTVPVRADDDHVRRLGQLLKKALEPSLRVYVEYGHRMLMPGTAGFKFAVAEQAKTAPGVPSPTEADDRRSALAFYARRAGEVFKVFAEGFDDPGRLVRVVAADARATADVEVLLGAEGLRGQVDALAIDALLGEALRGESWRTQVRRQDVQWLLDQLEQQSLPAVLGRVRNARAVADKHGVRLVGRSAGLALRTERSTRDPVVEKRFDEANRHPRVAKLYAALLDGWRTNGGELVAHVALATKYGRRGRFGAVERLSRLDTPKYQALMAFIDRSPQWWQAAPPQIVAKTLPEAGPASGLPPPQARATPPAAAPPVGFAGTVPPPEVDRTASWLIGATGVAALAAAAAFAGLHVEAAAERNRVLASETLPNDGSEARSLDDDAFLWSALAAASLSVAGAGLGTAGALNLTEPDRAQGRAGQWAWLTTAMGLVAATAGTVYLVKHLDALDARDQLIADGASDPSTAVSGPVRVRNDEAAAWSALSGVGFATAAVSFGTAVYLFVKEAQRVEYDMDVDTNIGDVIITPTGFQIRW